MTRVDVLEAEVYRNLWRFSLTRDSRLRPGMVGKISPSCESCRQRDSLS